MVSESSRLDSNDSDAERKFLAELFDQGLLIPGGAPGVYGHNRVFEDVIERLDALITRVADAEGAEYMRFPPATARSALEQSEFLNSFAQLLGTVFSFSGGAAEHQQLVERVADAADWSDLQRMTEIVLTPAACYPLYPLCTGTLPPAGRLVDMATWVYRHEPSQDPARLQFFRVREMVRLGTPQQAIEWRDAWRDRAVDLLVRLGLRASATTASDPFFGRGGRLLAANQREQGLKFEVIVPIASESSPTAVASFNYHQDHFGRCFAIRTPDGAVAHSGCLGFGMERVVLALFKQHGLQPSNWPTAVRQQLWQ
jgi:seryl-tRNA synthetase